MLKLQEYLRGGNPPEGLTETLGIRVYGHPSLPLVGFKYDQIASDGFKADPIVRESRGIVLERGSWDVVAKPFPRFFNAGEDAENFRKFRWDDFTCTTKEDGSLAILNHYRGGWHVNTSGSFGLGLVGDSGLTWRELFRRTARIDPKDLDPEWTYLFELWTPHNRVIRSYPSPRAFLLSMFHVPTLREATVEEADEWGRRLSVPRPEHLAFASMGEITEFLGEKGRSDRSFEGVVVRDCNNERYKIKSKSYLALHHLHDNGNGFLPKRLVPLILAGDTDEVLGYFPEVGPTLAAVRARMESSYEALERIWARTWTIESQKEFTLAVARETPFSGLLFELRKRLGTGQTPGDLRESWSRSESLILKAIRFDDLTPGCAVAEITEK